MPRPIGKLLIPMVTPFKSNGEVDLAKAGELAHWIRRTKRPDSLIVGGTTGEFFSMNFEERAGLIEAVFAAVGQKLPVIAGTGCASTCETVRLTRQAEKIGVDMAMVVGPYYGQPDQKGIYEHFRKVAKSTSLPIMLYNIPLFTGVNIEPSTLKRLAKIDNVVAIKEESGLNPLQSTRYLLSVSNGFSVYVGDDTMVLAILAQGGQGCVSGGAQICGGDMKNLVDSVQSGDLKRAQKINEKIFPLFEAFYQNGRVNPIPLVKAGIKLAGFDVGPPRSPLSPATPSEVRNLRKVMKERNYLHASQ